MLAWLLVIALRVRPDLPTVGINLTFVFLPALVLAGLTGQVWRSLLLGLGLSFLLQRLHSLKWKYLAQNWDVQDFRLLLDPDNWLIVGQYPELGLFTAAALLGLVTAWWLPKPRKLGMRARSIALATSLLMAGGVYSWRDHHAFDPFGHTYYGQFASLVYSSAAWGYTPPAVSSGSDQFRQHLQSLPPADRASTQVVRPDVVLWLQESTIDPALFDWPGAQLPRLDMLTRDRGTRAEGWLRVHTWGGSTWLTEFAVLAGLPHTEFGASGNSVFYSVTSQLRYSLPRQMRELGYHTVALTPTPKAFYNAQAAYRDLGFDEHLTPADFPGWDGRDLSQEWVSSSEIASYARQILLKPRNQPLFLYFLSVAEHGPYDSSTAADFGLEHAGLPADAVGRASDYFRRLQRLDQVTQSFGSELLSGSRPVLFAYFGDHHPNLDAALPYRSGISEARMLTPYRMKTNFAPASTHTTGQLDAGLLGSVILRQAGLPPGPFFGAEQAFLDLCAGQWIDCPDRGLVESFRAYLYRDLRAAVGPPEG